jgi:predicted small secreted protein
MKRIALFLLATSCFLFNTANAEDGGGSDLSVGGQAPPVCTFTAGLREVDSSNMSLSSPGANSGRILIDELIDQNTGHLNRASIQLELLGICNKAHHLTILTTKGGLAPAELKPVVSGSFIQHVNYRVDVSWAGRTSSLETDATPGKKSSAGLIEGPNSGPLNINVIIDESTNSLQTPTLEGLYSDSLIVQIGLPL